MSFVQNTAGAALSGVCRHRRPTVPTTRRPPTCGRDQMRENPVYAAVTGLVKNRWGEWKTRPREDYLALLTIDWDTRTNGGHDE